VWVGLHDWLARSDGARDALPVTDAVAVAGAVVTLAGPAGDAAAEVVATGVGVGDIGAGVASGEGGAGVPGWEVVAKGVFALCVAVAVAAAVCIAVEVADWARVLMHDVLPVPVPTAL
jgi:hypothetical protein